MKLRYVLFVYDFTLCWQSTEEEIVEVSGLMVKSLKEILTDEFRQYMAVPLTNWRVNNVMQWWGENEDKFPNVSKLARKYLAIPASSAPSERVFSQLKLMVERKRWRMDPASMMFSTDTEMVRWTIIRAKPIKRSSFIVDLM